MRISETIMGDPHLQAVLACLVEAGHQALLVGGCVRNALLGVPVEDIDIATDAPPETVTRVAQRCGLKVVPTGVDHGTVTVISGGKPHEVTTFRRDVETDGRRAVVAYSTRIEDDAARRDFTMNALYADRHGRVIDPLGGLSDLKARRVRFVGDPHERIAEDYLRILRFFRFHAIYGDAAAGLDAEGLAACAAHADGLGALSRERVGHEMRRLLAAPDPAPSVAAMQAAGILGQVLPGADARTLPVLVALEEGGHPGAMRRLAVLGGENPVANLRLSNAEARRLEAILAGTGSNQGPAELAFRHGADTARDIILVRAALAARPLAAGWRAEIERGAAAVFPVRAGDLPGLSGAALGARLKDLEARWVASDFRLSREQLLT